MHGDWIRMWKEPVVICFELLFSTFPARNKEVHVKSEDRGSRPRFESGASSRRAGHCRSPSDDRGKERIL
jgi:hypothetical protein